MYFLCCSIYFCVLCIVCFVSFSVLFVCTYTCTELLPPGGYPIAVKYITSYISPPHGSALDMGIINALMSMEHLSLNPNFCRSHVN